MLNVLPVGPWLGMALLLVLLVALSVPPPAEPPRTARAPGSGFAGTAAAAVGLSAVVLLVLVARLGPASVAENPVPAVVVGLAWPLLFLAPVVVGLVGRRPPRDDADAPADVRPAVAAAAVVVGYLSLVRTPTDPRTLAVALAAYALAVLALGIALGGSWVARTEVVGLMARWVALGPGLVRWHPPRGAALVLAVVLGGAWAERAQRTARWFEATPSRTDQVLLVMTCVAVAAAAALALRRWVPGGAAAVLVPLTAAAVVSGVLRRAVISAQLLWDTLGPGQTGATPDPLGVAGGQAAALSVAVLGGALAAAVLARRSGPAAARLPGVAVVLATTAVTGYLTLTP